MFIEKETLAQVFFCDFDETFKNTFFHRTPSVPCMKNASVSAVFKLETVTIYSSFWIYSAIIMMSRHWLVEYTILDFYLIKIALFPWIHYKFCWYNQNRQLLSFGNELFKRDATFSCFVFSRKSIKELQSKFQIRSAWQQSHSKRT